MKRLTLILLFFLLLTNCSWSQPGSYSFCFGFVLYDNGIVVSDPSKFQFNWVDDTIVIRTDFPCSKQIDKHSITYRLQCYHKQYILYIINSQKDTMRLTFLHETGMDQFFFVKKLPFQKGHYILSQNMFDYPYRLPENFDLLKENRDSIGNLIVEDYWDWDKKILKGKDVYNKEGNLIKYEYWWDNGNKSREGDNTKNTETTWYYNGQLEMESTGTTYLYLDKDGKIIKRAKSNQLTSEWENY